MLIRGLIRDPIHKQPRNIYQIRWCPKRLKWKENGNLGSDIWFANQLNTTIHSIDQMKRNNQTQSRAPDAPSCNWFTLHKGFKQIFLYLLAHANAIIFDVNPHLARGRHRHTETDMTIAFCQIMRGIFYS